MKQKEYVIIGYDKDNDCYIELYSNNNYNKVIIMAKKLKRLVQKDRLLNPYNNEPLDWLEVVDRYNPSAVYWASYKD